MSSAFRGFVRKEILHLLRDRQTLAILLLLPLIQMLLFGFAIRTEVDDIRLAIVDPAPDPATLELRNRLEASGLFDVGSVLTGTAGLKRMFEKGSVRQAIVFESGFAARLARGEPARVQILTDATDPNSGSAMQAYAMAVMQRYEAELRAARGGGATGFVQIVMQTRMRFNPTMRSENLFVPGLLAFVVTLVSALMTAISIAREKEMGTMEVLLVSPLRPWQIVAGKVVPYIGLGFGTVVLLLAVAQFVFDVPVRGNVALLLAECLLYTVTALSLGVLISTRATSQRTAMIAALAGLMLPTMLLSGFIFPIESMPQPLQLISNVVPAKWFVLIARGIMLKGVGLAYLWQETLVLAGMAAFLLLASTRSFKVRLQ